MNGWTPERRVRQARLIRQWRPWKKSTGPRTEVGKGKVARNAFKGGTRRDLRTMARLLRELLEDECEMRQQLCGPRETGYQTAALIRARVLVRA